MKISEGKIFELELILVLTKACGKHMREDGIDQWDENYLVRASLLRDLEKDTLFAYREGDEVLGIVVLNESQDEEYGEINWSTSANHRDIVVHRLAVRPAQQGQGLTRSPMDFVEQWARTHDGYF
jgi:GNAT superfamily N-acetyltransferase